MAGIFSQGGSAGHRYAGWLETVEAKNFQFGGKVFNGSPSAIYVGSNLVWMLGWLTKAAKQAILGAFGQTDGTAVINATNAYLNQLAASGQAGKDKATALAGFINEDPMMVCSLPMSEYLPSGFVMPKRYLVGDGTAYINTEIAPSANTLVSMDYCPMNDAEYYIFGARSSNSSLVIFVLNRYQGKIRSTDNNYWASTNYSINVNTDYNIGRVNNDVYGNGTKVYSGPQTLGTLPSDVMYIFTAQVYGAPSQHNGIFGLDKVKIGNAAHMITCKHNGQNGMYDIERMRWFGNANSSGSFTIPDISYTPLHPITRPSKRINKLIEAHRPANGSASTKINNKYKQNGDIETFESEVLQS